MYNKQHAIDQGFLTHCTAPFLEPVTVHGNYACLNGHQHFVSWVHGFPQASAWGYTPDFLAALNAADESAIAVDETASARHIHIHDAVLTQRGFGSVCLPVQSEEEGSHAIQR